MTRRIQMVAVAVLLALQVGAAAAQEGGAERGWLGVIYVGGGIDTETAEVQVERVHAGSPADEAGIHEGDVILRWNGAGDVRRAIGETRLQAGDTVRLRLRRGTVDRETLVVAAPRPRALAMPAPGGPGADPSAWEGLRERLQQQAERMRAEAQRMRAESRGMQEETARARGEAQRAQGEAARMRGEMQRVRGEAELEVMRGYLDDLRLRTLAIVADSLHRGLRVTLADSLHPRLEQMRVQLRDMGPHVAALRFVGSGMRGVAGAELEEMNDGLARYFGTDDGLLVLRVSEGTPADHAGLESGDVVLGANGRQLRSVEVLREEIARSRAVELDVLRSGERRALRLTWE